MRTRIGSFRSLPCLATVVSVFLVLADGEVLVHTKVESYATIEFDEPVDARDQGRARRVRERAFYDLQTMHIDPSEQRAANARRAGGKGGRGGV